MAHGVPAEVLHLPYRLLCLLIQLNVRSGLWEIHELEALRDLLPRTRHSVADCEPLQVDPRVLQVVEVMADPGDVVPGVGLPSDVQVSSSQRLKFWEVEPPLQEELDIFDYFLLGCHQFARAQH